MGSDRAAAAATAGASVGLSPAAGAGPVVSVGVADPVDDGCVVGRHRSDPRPSGVGHDAAGSPRRVDRGGRVRAADEPKRSPRSTASSGSTCPRSRSTAACTRRPTAARAPARTPLIVGSWAGSGPSPSDRHGVPIGWTIDGANRNDVRMLEPTLDDIAAAGLLVDIDTMHLDRGYDSGAVRQRLAGYGLTDVSHPTARHQGAGQASSRCGSGCAGSSKPPTRGGRTTASCAATPTAATATATPRCASPPSS